VLYLPLKIKSLHQIETTWLISIITKIILQCGRDKHLICAYMPQVRCHTNLAISIVLLSQEHTPEIFRSPTPRLPRGTLLSHPNTNNTCGNGHAWTLHPDIQLLANSLLFNGVYTHVEIWYIRRGKSRVTMTSLSLICIWQVSQFRGFKKTSVTKLEMSWPVACGSAFWRHPVHYILHSVRGRMRFTPHLNVLKYHWPQK